MIIGEGKYKRHIVSFGNGRNKYTFDKSFSIEKKYQIPKLLIQEIIYYVAKDTNKENK